MIQRFQAFLSGITVCYKYIQRIQASEMTAFGLRGADTACLFYLYHNPAGLTAADLCRLCAADKAAVSRTVAALTEQGYVRPADGKYRAKLTLTDAGAQVAAQMDAVISDWVAAGGDGLTDEERAVFYRALGKISENLRAKCGA